LLPLPSGLRKHGFEPTNENFDKIPWQTSWMEEGLFSKIFWYLKMLRHLAEEMALFGRWWRCDNAAQSPRYGCVNVRETTRRRMRKRKWSERRDKTSMGARGRGWRA